MTGVVTGCNVPLLHGDNSPSKLMLPCPSLGIWKFEPFSHQKHNVFCTFILIFRILNVLSVFSVIGVGAVFGGLVSAQEYLALRCCQQSAAPGFVVLVTSGVFVQQTSLGREENPFIACHCVCSRGELGCVTVRVKNLL